METAPGNQLAPATWMYVICDRDGSNPREIVNTYDKKIVKPLMRQDTASGRVRLDHPLADRIQSSDLLLKAYRTGNTAGNTTPDLKFVGPIVTCEENADTEGNLVQFNAVGGWWYIANRLLGKSAAGIAKGTAGTRFSRGTIMHWILSTINGDGFTGIADGTDTSSAGLDAHFGPVNFAPAGQAIVDIAVGLNAPEWEVAPQEPGAPPGSAVAIGGVIPKRIGTFNTYTRIGADKPGVVMEFGTDTAQVSSYKRSISRESMLTAAWALPPGFPSSSGAGAEFQPQLALADNATLAARGRYEGSITSEVAANDLRLALAQEHIDVRSVPRYLVTWTMAANATPRPWDKYVVGDRVRARAVVNGVIRFDALFRVWGITASVDIAGNETVELELAQPQ